MSFRAYCMNCESKITPPFWTVGQWVFCNPECHKEKIQKLKKPPEKLSLRKSFLLFLADFKAKMER